MQKRSSKRPAVNWKWLSIIVAVVGALPFLLYTNTFWFGLVFNDVETIRQVLSAGEPAPFDMILRPLTEPWVRASFVLDFMHYQTAFGWYHLVNVWIHLSAAVALALLVFAIARRIAADGADPVSPYSVAALAGLIYGSHPLAVQTATYLSARWSGLGASNFLFALLFFVLILSTEGAIRVWCVLLTLAYSIMCLASGEMSLMLVPSMVAVYYLLKPATLKWNEWALEHPIITPLTAVFSLAIPFFVLLGVQSAAVPNWHGFPKLEPIAYFATQAKAFLTYYTRVFFAPLGLSIDPPFAQAANFSDMLSIGGLLLVIACIYVMYRYRHHKLLFFGLWLTLAGYLPHSLIVQQDAVSDPAFYLSLSGLSLVAAWSLLEIWRGAIKSESPKVIPVVLVLGALSVVHNLNFRNDPALVASILTTNHRSVLGTALSARQKLNHEDFAGAVKDADEAISLDPNSALAYTIRGQAQLRMHRESEAKHSFEKATDLAIAQRLPILAQIKYGLAEAYIAMGNTERATDVANQAFRLDPHAPRAKYVMGLLALKNKNYPMAMSYLQEARRQGVVDAILPGAKVLLGMKQWSETAQLSRLVLKAGNDPEAQLILGNASLALNDLASAESALKEALKGRLHNAETMALLSILYERKGDKAVAESYHNEAMQLDAKIFSNLTLPAPKK